MAFIEFTTEKLIGLPPELFTEVLPAITLPSELKVTLHLFYRMSRTRGPAPKRVSWDELVTDRALKRSLRAVSKLRPSEELLAEGLDAAVHRTTLLHVVLPEEGRSVNWYVVNTAVNRLWAEQVHTANHALQANGTFEDEVDTLITLYERNIGLVTPMLLDELREAEDRYPRHWIEDAMREAVHANARSWRYIRKVLERWAAHGRQHATDRPERFSDPQKYTEGEYGGLFRLGSDTSDL